MRNTENGIFFDSQKEYFEWLNKRAQEQKKEDPEAVESSTSIPLGSNYELNQNIINQLSTLTLNRTARKRLKRWYYNQNKTEYFMFLCNDWKYYTVFHTNNFDNYQGFEKEFCEIVNDLGEVKVFEEDNNGAFAVWITDKEDSSIVRCFYLFPYDRGVVEIE